MCGTLLHGDVHLNASARSNKKYGPPIDRNGEQLQEVSGTPSTLAQPPCLLRFLVLRLWPCLQAAAWDMRVNKNLRFSPSLFANEAPEVFHHDGDTNCLRLAPGVKRPWLRHTCASDSSSSWIFCVGSQLASE